MSGWVAANLRTPFQRSKHATPTTAVRDGVSTNTRGYVIKAVFVIVFVYVRVCMFSTEIYGTVLSSLDKGRRGMGSGQSFGLGGINKRLVNPSSVIVDIAHTRKDANE